MIRYPFYKLGITYVVFGIILVWVYAIAVFSYYFFLQEWPDEQIYLMTMPHSAESFGLFINFVLPVTLNTVIYFYVFRVVRAKRVRIAALRVGAKQTSTTSVTSKRANSKLYLYVTCVFMVLWIPWSIMQISMFIRPSIYYDCVGGSVDAVISSLMFINNFGNAIIYGSSNRTFKNAFRKLLCTHQKVQQS